MAINPAGLALLNGRTVEVSVAGMFARGRFSNSANDHGGRLNSNGAVPYGAFGAPLGKRFTLGLAVTPELMSAANWSYTDAPGGAGGVSYGALRPRSAILAMRAAAGLGVYLGPRVQIGATSELSITQIPYKRHTCFRITPHSRD